MAGPPSYYVSLLFRRCIYQIDPTCLGAGRFPRIHFQSGVARQPGLETSFFVHYLPVYISMTCFISLVMVIVSPFEPDSTSVLATEIQLEASRSQFRHDHLTCFGPPYKNPCAVLYTYFVCNSSRVGLVRELRYSTAILQQEKPPYNYTSRDSQTPTSCLHPTLLSERSLARSSS
jgi:hypothetical protein